VNKKYVCWGESISFEFEWYFTPNHNSSVDSSSFFLRFHNELLTKEAGVHVLFETIKTAYLN